MSRITDPEVRLLAQCMQQVENKQRHDEKVAA